LARTVVAPQSILGPYPTLPVTANALDIAFTAPAVAADGISFPLTGHEVLLARNVAVGAQTITIQSAPDSRGRSGDITTYSIGAGEFIAFDARAQEGWRQSDGSFYAVMSTVDVEVAILRLSN